MTSRLITAHGGRFIIHAPGELAVAAELRRFAGRRWEEERRAWSVPADARTAALIASLADRHALPLDDAARRAAADTLSTAEGMKEASRAIDAVGLRADLASRLRPFQRAGVAYALRARRCFIADDMGLGKTIQSLATVEEAQAYPLIVVCPASVKLNWQREAEQWLPGRTTHVVNGSNPEAVNPLADINIVNYDVLARSRQIRQGNRIVRLFPMVEALRSLNPESVILDESHYVKNPDAKRTKACIELTKGVPRRLCLTGTPLLNRPVELVGQLKVLGRLDELFGGYRKFIVRYCDAKQGPFGLDVSGATNLRELNDRLRGACLVRRLKEDVLTELPAKQRSIVPMMLDNRREYDRAANDLIGWLKDQGDLKGAKAAARAETLVRIEKLRQLAVDGKLGSVRSWIDDFMESGKKLVVFAVHRGVVNGLAKYFADSYGARAITGETSMLERQNAVDAFQNDARCRMLVCNIRAAGVGLTLTAASDVAFVELPWTTGELDQAEDRCHRIGQRSSVTAWYLLASDTIDGAMAHLLSKKREIVHEATDGTGQADADILSELVGSLTATKKKGRRKEA